MTENDAVAFTAWGEGRNQPVEGRIAIACVLRNRLRLGRWGHTYAAVALAHAQFSCWDAIGGAANYAALQALVQLVAHGGPATDVILLEDRWIADGLIRGVLLDRVKGATHYHVVDLDPLPAWAVGHVPVARIGAHVFYQGIP